MTTYHPMDLEDNLVPLYQHNIELVKLLNCRCCGINVTTPELLLALVELRRLTGIKFHITSGTRCMSHNRHVGGALRSCHLTGRAMDIAVRGAELERICRKAPQAGFDQVLPYVARGFVHLGVVALRQEVTQFNRAPPQQKEASGLLPLASFCMYDFFCQEPNLLLSCLETFQGDVVTVGAIVQELTYPADGGRTGTGLLSDLRIGIAILQQTGNFESLGE